MGRWSIPGSVIIMNFHGVPGQVYSVHRLPRPRGGGAMEAWNWHMSEGMWGRGGWGLRQSVASGKLWGIDSYAREDSADRPGDARRQVDDESGVDYHLRSLS